MSKTRPYQPKFNDDIIMEEHYREQESRKEKRMDLAYVRHLLEQLSKRALNLSQRLSSSGQPLNQDDKDLIKMVKYDHLKEMLHELKIFFLTDNLIDLDTVLKRVRELAEDDSVI